MELCLLLTIVKSVFKGGSSAWPSDKSTINTGHAHFLIYPVLRQGWVRTDFVCSEEVSTVSTDFVTCGHDEVFEIADNRFSFADPWQHSGKSRPCGVQAQQEYRIHMLTACAETSRKRLNRKAALNTKG